MQTFRLRLEQALGSGAALALLSLPACGGSASIDGTPSASGSAGAPSATASAGASSAATGGQPTTNIAGAAGAAQSAIVSGGAPGAGGQPAPEGSGAGGGSSQSLTPYPANSLGCSGPSFDNGLHGQCCANALCYSPSAGSECVAPDDAPNKLGTFYGSGACLCGDGIQGPFAPNPAHQPEQTGTCCYVISSIGCDGRPLLVDGIAIVSALTGRSDWLVAELRELSI